METNHQTTAGFISTGFYALNTLRMQAKAFRPKEHAAQSLGDILLKNVGNIICSNGVIWLPRSEPIPSSNSRNFLKERGEK